MAPAILCFYHGKKKYCFVSGKLIMGAAVIGQEQSGKNRLLQGQGKEKELHSESGKIYTV